MRTHIPDTERMKSEAEANLPDGTKSVTYRYRLNVGDTVHADGLRDLVDRSEHSVRSWATRIPHTIFFCSMSVIGSLWLAQLFAGSSGVSKTISFGVSIICQIGLFYVVLPAWRLPPTSYQRAAASIAELGDQRYLAHFIEALRYGNATVRPAAERALIRTLPCVTPAVLKPITRRDRALLYHQLSSDDSELVKTLLKALPEFYDSDATPFVERLVTRVRQDSGEIHALAESTLARLREQEARLIDKDALLRSSSPVSCPTGELLRPTITKTGDEAQTLLRPEIE